MEIMSECIECGETFDLGDDEGEETLTARVIRHLKTEHDYLE